MALILHNGVVRLFSTAVRYRFMSHMLRGKYHPLVICAILCIVEQLEFVINVRLEIYRSFSQQVFYLAGSILTLFLLFRGSAAKKVLTAIMTDAIGYAANFIFLPAFIYIASNMGQSDGQLIFLLQSDLSILLAAVFYELIIRRYPALSGAVTNGCCIYLLGISVFLVHAVIYFTEQSAERLSSHAAAAALCTGYAVCGGGFILYSIYYTDRKMALMLVEQQMELQKRHMMELKEQWDRTSRFRHDMKNHMICLNNLLRGGHNSQAKAYLKSVAQTVDGLERPVTTGNLYVDAVLTEKYRLARREGIDMDIDMAIPTFDDKPPMDLIIILGNALDNAIEACMRRGDGPDRPCIKAQACVHRAYLVITVDNPLPDPHSQGIMEPLKRKQGFHGIGLLNIKEAVKRCQGTLDITVSEEMFHFCAMLLLYKDC